MQGKEENEKTKEKNSFRRKERSVFKKCLTGPTLLEMSGNPTNPALEPSRDRFGLAVLFCSRG
jgi:hypothetical protein